MAKMYGLNGVLSGRQGNNVFAVRNGEQILRKYQPVVLDPKSAAQTAVRAKFKLLSQLAAVMASVIAIPKDGPKTSRNQFTQKNYDTVTYANGVASIQLDAVQLTDSAVGLPALSSTESTVELIQATTTGAVSRVVYAKFARQADETLRYITSAVATEPGANSHWPVAMTAPVGSVIYAYGIKDLSELAEVKFGQMIAPSAEQVAKVVTSRMLNSGDIQMTETRSLVVNS